MATNDLAPGRGIRRELAIVSETKTSRRAGGRTARKALRATVPDAANRPVRPGMSSGRYAPLTNHDVERVHEAVLTLLEEVGLAQALPSCIDMVTHAGGRLDENGRLLFPRQLVEDTLAIAARDVTLRGRMPDFDLDLSGSRLHFGTAGAAVHVADVANREYRESTLADLYDAARLVDSLEHIHFFQRPLVARDMTSDLELDANTLYACVSGTRKHVGTSFVNAQTLAACTPMLHDIAGGEAQWRERPFVSISCCFVVPPLRFAEDACAVLEDGVRAGYPILLLAAGQAGATSPAALAGAVVQEVAEVLAGLVYVNLIAPGHPAIFGTWPFVSDLRTGAMSGGSGEQAVLMAACAQMGRHYGLPTGVAAGMADAKLPDIQAGYEKAYTNMLAAQSGANLVYESAGMHASLLGCCFESFVVDNDILGAILRTVRGVEVSDATLSLDTIRDVCINGPNHYLGSSQTLALMETEYLYPAVGDRTSPKEWVEQGKPDALTRATAHLSIVMREHFPQLIDSALDARIRERWPIHLLPEQMQPGNGRW
jgi:trimethylamine--corrinoid protein Co-methyltransferase